MTPITYETILQWADHEAGPLCMDKDYQAARRLLESAPDLLEALCDFSQYVYIEQSSTDGAVQYSNTQINRLAFKARDAIAKAIGGEA